MVAKSYESCEIVSEPYTKNNKSYVKINYRGSIKEVRWYTEAQHAAMYRKPATTKAKRTDRATFGFDRDDGILLFKGEYDDIYSFIQTLPAHTARYSTFFGWYIGDWCAESLELNLPCNVKTVWLPWSLVGNEDGYFKDPQSLQSIIYPLRNDPSPSVFMGEVGQKYSGELVCTKVTHVSTRYGVMYLHLFQDESKNIYKWATSSKQLETGVTYKVTYKVKAHEEYKGIKQTVINYVKEVK